ncbi:hypothetical protein [Nocardioides sp. AX2bis]|uniref:hypothetical protein n=1 Tax=Nocardioides sp. AX2bis TaxID=2653157 RepID=UPI0012F1ACC6|nr:hypothetical protein [Nocardioides sp. AX2bis]VXB44332.1 hypothetical protein NOCARDAX2BIS_220142 [Nocardioides sp. AX2bis]
MNEALAKDLLGWLSGEASRTTRIVKVKGTTTFRSSVAALTRELTRLEQEFRALASDADPMIAIPEFVDVDDPDVRWLVKSSLATRLTWTLATTASGTIRSKELATRCYKKLGEWWAVRFILTLITADPQSLATTSADAEGLHRVASQQIRYAWVTRLICTSMAQEVAQNPVASQRIPELTPGAVDALLDATIGYFTTGTLNLSQPAKALAQNFAQRAGSLAGRPLQDAIFHRDINAKPWILYPNGELLPIATLPAALGLEHAVLQLADDRLASLRLPATSKGEFFERVTQLCLADALNIQPASTGRPLKVRVSPADEGELDGALGNPVEVIFECKARMTPNGIGGIGGAFETDVVAAIGQVRERLDALTTGRSPIVDATGARFVRAEEVSGICVLAHPYGGSVVNPMMLDLTTAERDLVPIVAADIHTWIIVATALGSTAELRSFLKFRNRHYRWRIYATEEVDLLISFLNPNRSELTRAMSQSKVLRPDANQLMGGCSVPLDCSLLTPKPQPGRTWRQLLYAHAEVTNP